MDLYDRKIIDWSLSDGISTNETSLKAWKMAVKNRNIGEGLIFHSDKGVQYASKKFVNVLDSYKKITRNMSRKGNCWDNAVAESFFKSLKTELIYGTRLISKERIKLEIFEYIEVWYNRKRGHSALNYATIEEFNNQINYKNVALLNVHFLFAYPNNTRSNSGWIFNKVNLVCIRIAIKQIIKLTTRINY